MEPEKPSSLTGNLPPVDGGSNIDNRFQDLCKNVSLDDKTLEEANKLFNECKQHLSAANFASIGSVTLEEAEPHWFSFILYTVKRLTETSVDYTNKINEPNSFILSKSLRVLKLNIADFFKELPHIRVKVVQILRNMYGADWEQRLKAEELQADFENLVLLSKKYKNAFQEFFLSRAADVDEQSPVSSFTGPVLNYYRFGWLLFLVLRIHSLSRAKDRVTCTYGLVSVLAILILHVPVGLRSFTTDDSRFVKKGDKIDLVASLCNIYETSEDELRNTLEKTNEMVATVLNIKPSLASECDTENLGNIDSDGFTFFKDLMDDKSFTSCLSILEQKYEDASFNKGELDERIFFDCMPYSRKSEDATSIDGGLKRKYESIQSPEKTMTSPLSPEKFSNGSSVNGNVHSGLAKIAATPVTTAMTTAKWLRTVISPMPSKPPAGLELFLSSCDRDIKSDVVRRARIILEAIFPSSALAESCVNGNLQSMNLMDNQWAERRREEALKLYYRVLLAMCTAESQTLRANNLTALLTNERFHRCMLACSAELVLATYKTVTMLFPAVLEKTGITAFDLSKVIESFIRHEESLPRELRRHLNSLEERLLESLVWEKGSSLYNSFIVAKPALASEINHLGFLGEPMPSLDAIEMQNKMSCGSLTAVPALKKQETLPADNGDIRSPKRPCTENRSVLVERSSFTSPVKDRLLALNTLKAKPTPPPLQSAFASPARPNPRGGGETCAETAINVFLSKIAKLAAVRINGMVERLHLSQQIREKVYHLFQQILTQRTSLLFNRYIDQIILCCFYGVSKICQLNLTFREIIYNYRKQPHCKTQVFRSVFIDRSSTTHGNGRNKQDLVDIITFYNEVFIPTAKPLLVELAPAGTPQRTNRLPEVNIGNGQCPGSPKISPFPNVPDMSPRKVSATHNVYVSPLRSSKMDALISHSSKSYYACIGESTRAFQSPSKDLTSINNCLHGNRKVRSMLNFDEADVGLVSDSLVANSLCLQSGSSHSASGAPPP
ncbi:retinoblastoma-related protein [Impatiens glandulifera]|uniref:retinoblastoma-related protein n=1 Tax=Impatiens glandulifera TaxID=253017 RepID=UPI001FB16C31|nr:retinoblastoma-related protein [Impatiens glandulifera]